MGRPRCTRGSRGALPLCRQPGVGRSLKWQGRPVQTSHTDRASLTGGLGSSLQAREGCPHPAVYTDNLGRKRRALRVGLQGRRHLQHRCLWHMPTEVSTDLQEVAGKGSDEEGLAQGNRALPDPRTGKLRQGRGDRDRSTAGRGSRSSSHALPRASARPVMLMTPSSVERMAAPV